jgi:hypothetical protein
MTRIIKYCLIFFALFLYQNCGLLKSTQKEKARVFLVMVFNEERLINLEDDICNYYTTYNEFPQNYYILKTFLNESNNIPKDETIFSNLSIDTLNVSSIKYNFNLLPYLKIYDLGPKFNYFDSIKVKVFRGKLIFSDSLFSKTSNISDSLEIDSLIATVYKNGNIYDYTKADLDIIPYNYSERILIHPNCILH